MDEPEIFHMFITCLSSSPCTLCAFYPREQEIPTSLGLVHVLHTPFYKAELRVSGLFPSCPAELLVWLNLGQ